MVVENVQVTVLSELRIHWGRPFYVSRLMVDSAFSTFHVKQLINPGPSYLATSLNPPTFVAPSPAHLRGKRMTLSYIQCAASAFRCDRCCDQSRLLPHHVISPYLVGPPPPNSCIQWSYGRVYT